MPQHAMRFIWCGQCLHLRIVQLHIQRSNGVIQMRKLARPDDRRSHTRLRQHPRQRHLRIRDSPFLRDLRNPLDHLESQTADSTVSYRNRRSLREPCRRNPPGGDFLRRTRAPADSTASPRSLPRCTAASSRALLRDKSNCSDSASRRICGIPSAAFPGCPRSRFGTWESIRSAIQADSTCSWPARSRGGKPGETVHCSSQFYRRRPAGLGVERDDARATQGQVLLGRQAGGLLREWRGALRASGLASTERMRTTYNGGVEGSYISLPFGDGRRTLRHGSGRADHSPAQYDTETATDHAPVRAICRYARPLAHTNPYSSSYGWKTRRASIDMCMRGTIHWPLLIQAGDG